MGRAHRAHRRRRAVLLVVGVEDEEDVERPGQRRVGVVARLGDLPHHRQEVGGEVEAVVGVDERHAGREAVGARGQRRHLGHEPDGLAQHVVAVEVLRLRVEGREGRHGRDEHAHGVGVVVEALHEPLPHVLVDERVVRDVIAPLLELGGVGELAEDEEVGHLEVARVLGELLDRITAVAQDAGLAVELGDRALGSGRRTERRIEEPQPRHQLGPGLRVRTTVDDRDLHRFAGAVVGDGDGVCHGGHPTAIGDCHEPVLGPFTRCSRVDSVGPGGSDRSHRAA